MADDERRITNIYLGIGGAFGFIMASFGLAATVAWVTQAGLGPVQLIALGSALELTVLLSEIPTGVVADTMSRKWSIVVSFTLISVGLFANTSDSFAVLLVAQVVWGFGFTFQSGAVTAWVTDELGRDVDDLIIGRARVQQVGFFLGTLAGIGIGALSLDVAIATAAAVSLIVALVLASIMPETKFRPVPRDERSTWTSMVDTAVAGAKVLRGYPITKVVIVAALIGGFASEVVDRLMVLRLIDVGVPQVDPVVAIGGLILVARVAVWVVLGRLRGQFDSGSVRRSAAMIGTAYAVTAAAVLALAVGPIFAVAGVGAILQSAARQTVEPIEVAVINRRATAQHRATILSFHGQADAVGQVAGGLSLAAIAYLTSVSTAMGIGAALFAVAAFTVARLTRTATD